jgi:hypothetical protein
MKQLLERSINTMPKAKKLNISTLKQAHDKNFTHKKIIVNIDNKDYPILLSEKFEITKVQDMISELLEVHKTFIDMKEVWNLPIFSIFLLLKHFTDLELDGLSYAEAVQVVKYLTDFEVIETIVGAFDDAEVAKFNKYMLKAKENVNKFLKNPEAQLELSNMFAELKQEFGDDLEVEVSETEENQEVIEDA